MEGFSLPGPIIQEIHITTSFQNLGLSAELLRAVAEQGYTEPTPIQQQAIPVVLAGRDLLGAAQTGTGKTAGFTLPILQILSSRPSTAPGKHPVRVLILTPTRELTAQVHESVRTYGKHLKLRSAVVFGGVGFMPQVAELRRGADIVVATPGRLLDHVQQRTIDLKNVEILVLDEADRMLDMGFLPDIRRILALLPKQRQNLLFSATFPDEIRKLSGSFMRDPATVEVAARNVPIELVKQIAHPVDKDRKRELLAHLVKTNNWQQVLVFTKTKHGANRLAEQLGKDGIETDAIHGNKSQGARTRALRRFKDMELQVLVATDIAARGIDIDALPHVVNYDLPHVAEDYVHRIGRTGRAGSTGEAISLVCREDKPLLQAIERLMKKEVEKKIVPGFELGSASSRPASAQDRDERPARQGRPPQRQQEQRRRQPQRDSQQRGGQRRNGGFDAGNASSARQRGSSNGFRVQGAAPVQAREISDDIGNRAPVVQGPDPVLKYDERQPESFESRLLERVTGPAQQQPRSGQNGQQRNGQQRRNRQSPALFGPRKVA